MRNKFQELPSVVAKVIAKIYIIPHFIFKLLQDIVNAQEDLQAETEILNMQLQDLEMLSNFPGENYLCHIRKKLKIVSNCYKKLGNIEKSDEALKCLEKFVGFTIASNQALEELISEKLMGVLDYENSES